MKKIVFAVALAVAGLVTFGCKDPVVDPSLDSCLHADFKYGYDKTHHWKVCDLCGESFDKANHDGTLVEVYDASIKYKCSECSEHYVVNINNDLKDFCTTVVPITTAEQYEKYGVEPIKGTSYVTFGVYPQTVKDDSVEILTPEKNAAQSPNTVQALAGNHSIYLGSDGEWYFRQLAGYVKPAKFLDELVTKKYSTGKDVVSNEQTYFKMEPVVWRKVTLVEDNDDTADYLITDKCLEAVQYYRGTKSGRTDNGTKIQDSDYLYSDLFAFLTTSCTNTFDGVKLFDYASMTPNTCTGSLLCKMFYKIDDISNKLDSITVDGKQAYAIVPSHQQLYYAYGTPKKQIRKPTDYAIATGIKADENGNCSWWTRTPADVDPTTGLSKYAIIVRGDGSYYMGNTSNYINNVDNQSVGVIPCIKLQAK